MKPLASLRLAVAVSAPLFFSMPMLHADEVPSSPIAKKGELLFTDDFSEASSAENWKNIIPAFTVEDGVLKGVQAREDHGAVGRVYQKFTDAVIEFRFKLVGTPNFNAVVDDRNFKGSHAGHILRVSFAPTQVRLGDDKEGVMRNDIFEMRRDPEKKAEANKLLEGRGSAAKQTIEQERWYAVQIEILGDEMRVSLDGEPIGYLKSSGIAHETKESFHFTVNGKGALFDDVKIWAAEPAEN